MEDDVKKMDEVTELDLMKEFMKLTNKPLEPNEITVNSFMEQMGVPRNRARYILSKYEQNNTLKVRKVKIGSNSVNAYSPREGTWKDVVDKLKNEE